MAEIRRGASIFYECPMSCPIIQASGAEAGIIATDSDNNGVRHYKVWEDACSLDFEPKQICDQPQFTPRPNLRGLCNLRGAKVF